MGFPCSILHRPGAVPALCVCVCARARARACVCLLLLPEAIRQLPLRLLQLL